MSKTTIHKIPLQVLLASVIFVPSSDVRPYLTYVKVEKGYVVSTNGYCLFKCDIDDLDKELDLFIHPHQIKLLCTGIKAKDKKGDVIIEVTENDEKSVVVMRFDKNAITFENIKVGNFPNPNRVIPSDDNVTNEMVTLNWDYMAKMQKAGKILGNLTPPSIKSTGKNKPVLIDFGKIKFKAVGLVMPIKEW
ncbi:hypothetical protein LP109_05550 [Moraxella bovis]|uniref:hypothetical protein n=1 Tax=Moraxella bovis TaxID=476 RepID=UPI0009943F02|nr:hypothetical protein [Moraxella bovis]OOR90797.1 hypothetical protein B0182_04580 [Moraxella bovis]UZA17747.1 hypothetical protein LP109_05550 [Moraxella bovis]